MTARYLVGNATMQHYAACRNLVLAEQAMQQLLRECPAIPASIVDRWAPPGAIERYTYTVVVSVGREAQATYHYRLVAIDQRPT